MCRCAAKLMDTFCSQHVRLTHRYAQLHSHMPHHMVAISSPRFLLSNQRLGSEPDSQKESIGTIFKSLALNLRVEQFFEVDFFLSPLFELYKQK
jgi:hypothetical protein